MIIRFKNIVYIFIVTLVILLIIKNWGFITDIYKYNIYKENCIITKINDQKNVSICDYFEKTCNFIAKALEIKNTNQDEKDNNSSNGNSDISENKVFVHCKEGMSRSATIVIAYLMKSMNFRYDDALKYVKSRRPIVDPNPGFRSQLKQLDEQLCLIFK